MIDVAAAPPESPWRRRLRALAIHVLVPVGLLLVFISCTTYIGWHGPWTDSAAFLAVAVFNTFSIWTAPWNANLMIAWRVIITVVAVPLIFVCLAFVSYAIRVDFG